jgi:DNA-binding SARP family transcriptional activator
MIMRSGSRIDRARAVLSGLAAIAALAAIVAGLPIVLYRYGGSPVPRHLASWHQMVAVLRSRDNGNLLIAVVRDCSWLAWLVFAICVVAEIQAAARRRHAPRLYLGGFQSMAARMVALAALTFSTPAAVSLSPAAAAVSSHAIAAAGTAAELQLTALQRQNSPAIGARELDQATTRIVTVHRGDCLWLIAQHYLGAGDRYPEIASLNYGRDMGDGQIFTNPAFIEPGWQLIVPAGGMPRQPLTSNGTSQHLGHGTRDTHFRRRHSAAMHRPADPPINKSHGGNAADDTPAAPPHSAASRESLESAGSRTAASSGQPGDDLATVAVFVAGALTGAVLTSLNRLRRRQRQARRRGRRIALPADPRTLAAEQRLRARISRQPGAPAVPGDPGDTVLPERDADSPSQQPPETLGDALALLQAGIGATGQALPDIVGLHVTPTALEVLLSAPASQSPPGPFEIVPGRQGMCWQLDLTRAIQPGGSIQGGKVSHEPRVASIAQPEAAGTQLLPGLLTAGPTDAGYLLLDLEALQVTGCDGAPELVDRFMTTAAAELATGQWSGWYELVLVGFDELEALGRAEHYASVDEAITQISSRRSAVGRRLASMPSSDIRELRLHAPNDEDWGLTIMVTRIEPSGEQVRRLLELAEVCPGGLAVLMAGDPEAPDGQMAPAALQLAPDPEASDGIIANVNPLQITVWPTALSAADYLAITTLFATAAELADVGQDEEPYLMYGAPPWIPQAAAIQAPAELAESSPADGDVGGQQPLASPAAVNLDPRPAPRHAAAQRLQVKILGPFVIGGSVEPLQPKQAELVLALALAAPGGLSNPALCAMLGADPDHPKPGDAVRQLITRTRRRLGQARDGQEYIIHAGNGHYVLHPDSSLDLTEFRDLAASGRADDLRLAVSLIRGQPFSGSYFWWIDIPLLESVRAELVDVAEMLAEFELANGFARAAARAARAGLLADASAEQLWRGVMRAEHAAGNLAGVTEAWRRCLDAIRDIAPGGEPHADTDDLYRQLAASARQHIPASPRLLLEK